MCRMVISIGTFFIISNFVRGVKGQNMVHNDKKFCLLHSISEEPYIMTVIYVCKMIISSGFFSILFQNFGFLGPQGGKRAKNGLK